MPSAVHPLHLVLGLVVWSAWFVALYAGLSVGCAVAPPDEALGPLNWINGMLLLLSIAIAALLLSWGRRCWRVGAARSANARRRFIAWIGARVHLVAAGAVLAIGLPVVALPPCV
jgi:hypothetical protein